MKFHQSASELFIPDGAALPAALERTTHLAVSAHQDDLEIMAAAPILECFQHKEKWFTGVVVTDGRGSPRAGFYAAYTDEEMWAVRRKEQKKAAIVGEFAALSLLDHPSSSIKDGSNRKPVEDIVALLSACKPQILYTHNLADKHDTHVGVALKTIAAARALPAADRPQKAYGCEVWRDLDWMVDDDKIGFDVSAMENLQASLLGVYDSQITGGKRYDLASMGRRRAHATYFASHGVDTATGITFGMDLTPLIADPQLDIAEYVHGYIHRFSQDVGGRFKRLGLK
ncbi:MAG: PIG-L family deacetylase [Anaerolineales bacterium]|nr:PIG-L family deacetylase [Anaerolineales bacterium]